MSNGVRKALASVDSSVPNLARIHDYFLGGKDNFAADRAAAEKIIALAPELRDNALEGMAFRKRLIRHLVERGITQFVTLGAGLPAPSNIHAIAQAADPRARTVYVDSDTVVLNHARAVLATDPLTGVVRGDLLHPGELLADPGLREVVDLGRPLAILILSLLQYIPDVDGAYECVARLSAALPSGGYLVVTHVVFDERPEAAPPLVELFQRILNRDEDATRTIKDVERFFDGLELEEPGVEYVRRWRTGARERRGPRRIGSVVGIGRKP